MTTAPNLQSGLVVAGHGRHVWIETPDGRRLICHPRGKKNSAVVGDRVLWQPSEDEGTIEKVEPRDNIFYRQDEIRTKSFAANLDQVLILIAAEPEYSETQLARALIGAESENLKVIIALNKSDLTKPFSQAWQRLSPFRDIGYTLIPLALKPRVPDGSSHTMDSDGSDLKVLEPLLKGKTTLVLGPSGSGKSTLINRLVPGVQVLTNEISSALNSGKHTTTSTSLYWVDRPTRTAVIDSPGFQEFGLNHVEPTHLAGLMPDIRAFASDCKFYNCTHLHEPGCSVISSLENPKAEMKIDHRRYKIYGELFAELSKKRF